MKKTSNGASICARELAQWMDGTLDINKFKDYAPNGLQVEGRANIRHIVTGVTASQALIQEAITRGADTLLVHHGWFWKNESPCIIGSKRQRLAAVLKHELNLFGYHLPLDAHPTLGNNAQLAQLFGFTPARCPEGTPDTFGPYDLVWHGECAPQRLVELGAHIGRCLQRTPLVLGDANKTIRRVAWCSGGAQGMMAAAIERGVDLYITGEASEPNFHLAQETDTAFIAAGHHATERYGIKALGEAITSEFGVRVDFIDLDNPI